MLRWADAGIVTGFLLADRKQLRRQIIMGLGITDCFIAADVLASNVVALDGDTLTGAACTVSSFICTRPR